MRNIILILILLTLKIYADTEYVEKPILLVDFSNNELKEDVKPLALSLRENLILLEQETTKRSITERSEIFFSFADLDSGKALIKIIPPIKEEKEIIFSFANLMISNDNKVLGFNMQETGASSAQPMHVVRNTSFNEEGKIKVRIILKTISMQVPGKEVITGNKFLQGVAVNYKYKENSNNASEYAKREFIILPSGSFRTTTLKESLNRTFTKEGFLSGETIRETKYSYQDPVMENYAIFNPNLSPQGVLSSVDIHFLPRINSDTFSPSEDSFERYNIYFLHNDTFNRSGKRIKSFRFTEDNKAEVFELTDLAKILDPENRVKATMEIHYRREINNKIPLFIPDIVNIEYNADFNKNLVTRKHSLSFKNTGSDFMTLSSRNTEISYKENMPENINISYYNTLPPFNAEPLRNLIINITERSDNKLPVRLSLKLAIPGSEDSPIEQEIIQDCNYILKQALSGTLFHPDRENMQHFSFASFPAVISRILPAPLELGQEDGILTIVSLAAYQSREENVSNTNSEKEG